MSALFTLLKMLKKIALPLFVMITFASSAQNYSGALGVRLGFSVGLSFKTMFDNSNALELIAAYQWNEHGYSFTPLYEKHNYRILGAAHLALFYGAGAHLAYYDGGYYKNREGIEYLDNTFNFGVDAILGIDYYEPNSSIDWSVDVKPMYDFVNPGLRFWDACLSVRYAFQ
jgi:hypothetical protein